MQTITINNFNAQLTRNKIGDLTSGFVDFDKSSGTNPFIDPGALIFSDTPTQIGVGVITDMIIAKVNVQTTTTYSNQSLVIVVGNTGRVYLIKSNDPTTDNPDYDLATYQMTLSAGSPTFTSGASIYYNRDTLRIYIAHDTGVSRIAIDTNGVYIPSSESYIGTTVGAPNAWITSPRPMVMSGSNLYVGNWHNIATVNIGTETVTSYQTLNPAFPAQYTITDMSLSSDGSYLSIVASQLNSGYFINQHESSSDHSSGSTVYARWNMIDAAVSQMYTLSKFEATCIRAIGQSDIILGTDMYGGAIYDATKKMFTTRNTRTPFFSAVTTSGEMLYWLTQDTVSGSQVMSLYGFGSFDGSTYSAYRLLRNSSIIPGGTQIVSCPMLSLVSGENLYHNTITNNSRSTAKMYASVLFSDGTFKFLSINIGTPKGTPEPTSTYTTQSQAFSKRMVVKEVRMYYDDYTSSAPTNLTVSIGRLSGVSKDFTATMNNTTNSMMAAFAPSTSPTYEFQISIKAPSVLIPTIRKVEVDVTEAGK